MGSRVEPEDEKYLDEFAVFTDRRMKNFSDVSLMPDGDGATIIKDGKTTVGRHKVVIDTERYQRGATTEVQSILATIKSGGVIPAVKTAVLRGNGDIAIIDGGQTWRAALHKDARVPMAVRLYEFDDPVLEAKLFYLLNRMRPVTSDIRIRACSAASAHFLRDLNDEKVTKNLFWKQNGEPGRVSPTAALKAFVKLFTDEAAVGTDISSVMAALDLPSAFGPVDRNNRSNRDIARAFLGEVVATFSRPTIVAVVALAETKRRRELKPFSKPMIKAMGKETKTTLRTMEALKEFSRAKRIEMFADILMARIEKLKK